MTSPPKRLDEARVIIYTTSELNGVDNFGWAQTADGEDIEILGLAICSYEAEEGFYVFACNKQWKVLGDLFFFDLREATSNAESFYEVRNIKWEELERRT